MCIRDRVVIKQTQSNGLFQLPVTIDIYNGANKKRHLVWAKNAADTFYFSSAKKPDLINVDADKVLLAEKKETKTIEEYIHQFKYGGHYLDRREAIDMASKKISESAAYAIVTAGSVSYTHLDVYKRQVYNKADYYQIEYRGSYFVQLQKTL